MTTSLRNNWWAVLTAALASAVLIGAAAVVTIGANDDGNALVGPIGAASAVLVSGLLIAGLIRRRTDLIGGSRLIVAGAALTVLAGLEFIPVGVIVVISGMWTGNIQLNDRVDEPALAAVSRHQLDLTRYWHVWLAVAAVLFAVGWLPLIFDDPDDLTFGGWITWALSWLAAIVTGGIAVILGGLRLVVRHRTRPT